MQRIAELFPDLAYIHVSEPRLSWMQVIDPGEQVRKIIFFSLKPPTNLSFQSNDFVRKIWAPRPIISTGGYDRKLAMEVADNQGDLIAFGRSFIANVSASIV